jgi:hypothetical protein
MLVCVFVCDYLHARPRVQRAPGLPCALFFLGRMLFAKLGRMVSRECGGVFSRHCEEPLRRSNPALSLRLLDCFTCARNDETKPTSSRPPRRDPYAVSFVFREALVIPVELLCDDHRRWGYGSRRKAGTTWSFGETPCPSTSLRGALAMAGMTGLPLHDKFSPLFPLQFLQRII